MRPQGTDETVLVFRHAQVSGTGYGLGSYAVAFAVESTQAGIDQLEVVLGPDRRVRRWRLSAPRRETPLWPSE